MNIINADIFNAILTISKGDEFIGCRFLNCKIDDVTNAPFDGFVFKACIFENDVTFMSGFGTGGASKVIHEDSFLES